MQQIRVLIADDDRASVEALVQVLSSDESLVVIGAAHDSDEAIRLVRRDRPDVALIHPRLPGGGGAKAIRAIRAEWRGAHLLVISGDPDPGPALELLRAGALGYLVKGASDEEIRDAIHFAADGKSVLSSEVTGWVVDQLRDSDQTTDARAETERHAGRIRKLLADHEFAMVFQPIYELKGSHPVGVEALTRFMLEPRQRPDVWFAAAHAAGLGVELELATARAAVDRLAELPEDMYLSLNLSPEAASSLGLLELLDGRVEGRLVIEVTEHAAVEDYNRLRAALHDMRKLGVRLAIDNVGAGFSSLRHILRLSPDFIKMDAVLCQHVTEPAGQALIGGLVSYAAQVNALVVAEGIETREQLEAVQQAGVLYGQGYLLGKPVHLPSQLPKALTA